MNVSTNRAALYTPDINIYDQYTGKTLYVPPSGYVGGVLAYTDQVAYPWFAPAGLRRGQLPNALGVREKYSQPQRKALKNAQVNYIRDIPGMGRAVFEQRTLQGYQSGFSFLNVRRLVDYLHITSLNFVVWETFEPNDDFTRNIIILGLNSELEAVKTLEA